MHLQHFSELKQLSRCRKTAYFQLIFPFSDGVNFKDARQTRGHPPRANQKRSRNIWRARPTGRGLRSYDPPTGQTLTFFAVSKTSPIFEFQKFGNSSKFALEREKTVKLTVYYSKQIWTYCTHTHTNCCLFL